MFKNKGIRFKNINIYTANCLEQIEQTTPSKNECVNQSIWFHYFMHEFNLLSHYLTQK